MNCVTKCSFIFSFLIFNILSVFSQTSNFNWAVQGGGRSNDNANAVDVDDLGNIYVTGNVFDTSVFIDTALVAGFSDVFIAKLNPSGERQWVKLAGGTLSDVGNDIAVDANNNVIITGYYWGSAAFGDTTIIGQHRKDIFIAKYNSNGEFLWVVNGVGSEDDVGYGIDVDNNNNIYVAGSFESSLTFGTVSFNTGSATEIFLLKLNENGVPLWGRQSVDVVSPYDDEAFCITVDPDGNAIISGYIDDDANFDGTILTAYEDDDIFIAKYTPSGSLSWATLAGGSTDDQGNGIATDSEHNIYLTGKFGTTAYFGNDSLVSFPGGPDIFIAKYDSAGNFLWARKGGGNTSDAGRAIAVYGNSDVFVTGTFNSEATFGDTTLINTGTNDIFITKYNSSGNLVWIDRAGGNGLDDGFGIAAYAPESLTVVGRFSESCYFGHYPMNVVELSDLFIVSVNTTLYTSVENDGDLPEKIHLSQNYPNPFNPTTKIKFSVPTSDVEKAKFAYRTNVVLNVYDILGNKITTLVNEHKSPGRYDVEFNGTELSSGIYFYQLKMGGFVDTKKMLLLK